MVTHYVIIVVFFAVLLLIGALATKRIRNLSDYYVGGKGLGFWVVAFSARATGESAWLYLGLTGMGAMVGLQALWVMVGELLGVGLAWFLMAKPFKAATDRYQSLTVPDYLVSRFATSERTAFLLRTAAAGALVLFVTIYVSAQIDATGKAFGSFLGWNYYAGAIVGFAIVVTYTLTGGFVAVAWSDLFQGLLMLAGLIALPIAALLAVPAGSDLPSELSRMGHGLTNIFGAGGLTLSNALIIVSFVAIGLGFLGSPQVFVRFIAVRDQEEIRRGRWVAIVFTLLTDTGAILSGLLGRYLLVPDGGDFSTILGAGGEHVLPKLVEHLFPTVIIGIYIASVLAAIMSTIDSLLVVASSAVTRDLYQQTWKPELSALTLTKVSRGVTLLLAVVALVISLTVSYLSPDRTIFWYVVFGWSGIAATFCPTIILSLCWPRFHAVGALASMATGFACVPIFKFAVPRIPQWGPTLAKMEELAPSFLLSLCAGILVTLCTRKGETRPEA